MKEETNVKLNDGKSYTPFIDTRGSINLLILDIIDWAHTNNMPDFKPDKPPGMLLYISEMYKKYIAQSSANKPVAISYKLAVLDDHYPSLGSNVIHENGQMYLFGTLAECIEGDPFQNPSSIKKKLSSIMGASKRKQIDLIGFYLVHQNQ